MNTLQILRFVWLMLTLILLGPVQAAFTDNGDGTVTDTVTGLMWDQCAWGLSGANCSTGIASRHNWSAALGVAVTANSGNYKGYTDWRLPNRKELDSLVDLTRSFPAINVTAFPNTSSSFWSSTVYAPDPASTLAWGVSFSFGNDGIGDQSDLNRVRLVRSGQLLSTFDELAPALSPVAQSVSGTVGRGQNVYGFKTVKPEAMVTFGIY